MVQKKKKDKLSKTTKAILENRPAFAEDTPKEHLDRDELLLPRIDVAQALSPQIEEEDPAFIPKLKKGDLFNTATGQIYGKSLQFISVAYQKEFLLFQDRDAGGGFGGSYVTEEAAVAAIKDLDGDAWEPILSLSNLAMILDKDGNNIELAYISATRTKLKVMRKMNTHLQMVSAARYATVFELSTIKEEGSKGTYYNFAIRPIGWLGNRDTYEEATTIAKQMKGRRFSEKKEEKSDDKGGDY